MIRYMGTMAEVNKFAISSKNVLHPATYKLMSYEVLQYNSALHAPVVFVICIICFIPLKYAHSNIWTIRMVRPNNPLYRKYPYVDIPFI